MRKYISTSTVSFTVNVGMAQRRIRFQPDSRGGSILLTNDVDLCKAIEARADFGTLYRLDPKWDGNKVKIIASTPQKPIVKPKGDEDKIAESDEDKIVESDEDKIAESDEDKIAGAATAVENVQTLSEAKDYLIGLGAQPTAVGNKAGITAAAAKLNVSFPNLK